MTVTTEQALTKARELLDDPAHWIKGEFFNEDATAFCSLGALGKAYGDLGVDGDDHDYTYGVDTPAHAVLQEVLRSEGNEIPSDFGAPYVSVSRWNDEPQRTHAEVLDLFDKAIIRAAQPVPA